MASSSVIKENTHSNLLEEPSLVNSGWWDHNVKIWIEWTFGKASFTDKDTLLNSSNSLERAATIPNLKGITLILKKLVNSLKSDDAPLSTDSHSTRKPTMYGSMVVELRGCRLKPDSNQPGAYICRSDRESSPWQPEGVHRQLHRLESLPPLSLRRCAGYP